LARGLIVKYSRYRFMFKIIILNKVLRLSNRKIYAMKMVQIKELKEKDRENALNEVRLLASFSNPFIISYKVSYLK